MTYLDYSATTKIDELVLKEVTESLFDEATKSDLDYYEKEIQKTLNTNHNVIFTSGSTESNNLAIKGVFENSNKKEIITTHLEHSSINETLKYLETKGAVIKCVSLKDGIVDLQDLKNLINDNTSLITITAVNSETGMLNPIEKISTLAKENNVIFHCDMTQSIGKVNVPLDNVDLISISGHKFYGPKGIGVLLKKENITLKKQIYGERKYNLGLIKGFAKALNIAITNLDENLNKVQELNKTLIKSLKTLPNMTINSNDNSIPHIVNISVSNYKPETFLHYLEMNDIYISTQSACAKGDYSEAVYEITKDMKRAETSVRISLSHHTNKRDIEKLINVIKRSEHGR